MKRKRTDPSGSAWYQVDVQTIVRGGIWAHSPEHARERAAQMYHVPLDAVVLVEDGLHVVPLQQARDEKTSDSPGERNGEVLCCLDTRVTDERKRYDSQQSSGE